MFTGGVSSDGRGLNAHGLVSGKVGETPDQELGRILQNQGTGVDLQQVSAWSHEGCVCARVARQVDGEPDRKFKIRIR